jgi:hypothetical protein
MLSPFSASVGAVDQDRQAVDTDPVLFAILDALDQDLPIAGRSALHTFLSLFCILAHAAPPVLIACLFCKAVGYVSAITCRETYTWMITTAGHG